MAVFGAALEEDAAIGMIGVAAIEFTPSRVVPSRSR